jgi:hypothetical protein
MKRSLILILFTLTIFSCEKESNTPILDLNGTYEGTYTGWSQPYPISGTSTWKIRHVADSVFADIQGSTFPDSFEGKVMNDSLITGYFIIQGSGPSRSVVNGSIKDFGNELTIETSRSDPAYNYFRIRYELKKNPN